MLIKVIIKDFKETEDIFDISDRISDVFKKIGLEQTGSGFNLVNQERDISFEPKKQIEEQDKAYEQELRDNEPDSDWDDNDEEFDHV